MSAHTGRARTRVNPAVIKAVLDHLETDTFRGTSEATGWNVSTIVRWKKRRDASGGDWPTPELIAAWEADDAANGERRRIRAARGDDYRKRLYLNRGPILVPAVGTTRRLRALYALGWTERDLAEGLGVSLCRVSHLLTERRPTLSPDTVARVAALYDELSMAVPADTKPLRRGQTKHHARARRRARVLGWHPPLAWDDDAIDDPDAQPYGLRTNDFRAHVTRPDPDQEPCDRCGVRRQVRRRGELCIDCKGMGREAS